MPETVTSTRSRFPEIREQKDSLEDLIGVRSIMVEQESLFKEQVQALHRLYKVQKLEMQEFENKKKHLTTLETAELTDGFSSISQSEDKSGALVRPVARVYKPETGSLSLHPFCSIKLFEGSGSVSFGGSFQRPDDSQSKQVKNFDLERFPEGVTKVEIPKMELFYDGQTPRSRPQCPSSDRQPWSLKTDSKQVEKHASEGLQSSEITAGATDLLRHRKTGVETPLTKGGGNEYTQEKRVAGTSAGPAPKNSIDVQQLPVQGKAETDPEASVFRASSDESFNPSNKRHWNGNIATEAGFDDKLINISKNAKMSPSRSTP